MQNFKRWLIAASVLTALTGAVVLINMSASRVVASEERPAGDHWQNFDGHWSLWNEADKRWYYTDGKHWYYHNGKSWAVYEFDKLFGKKDFVHGDYKVPVDHSRIEVPKHDVYRR
ncbi:MAG TPA: hypothetical protein VGJ26_08445 [Pirellulales bacterium]